MMMALSLTHAFVGFASHPPCGILFERRRSLPKRLCIPSSSVPAPVFAERYRRCQGSSSCRSMRPFARPRVHGKMGSARYSCSGSPTRRTTPVRGPGTPTLRYKPRCGLSRRRPATSLLSLTSACVSTPHTVTAASSMGRRSSTIPASRCWPVRRSPTRSPAQTSSRHRT